MIFSGHKLDYFPQCPNIQYEAGQTVKMHDIIKSSCTYFINSTNGQPESQSQCQN